MTVVLIIHIVIENKVTTYQSIFDKNGIFLELDILC